MRTNYFLLALLLLTMGASCKWRAKDGIEWDQNLVAPILKSRIGLGDALKDASFVHADLDNSLVVVFRDTLVSLKLEDYLVVPDTSYAAKIRLTTIALATDTLIQDITLGQMLDQLCQQGQQFACTLRDYANNGTPLPFGSPPIPNIVGGDVPINASQFFDEADLLTGWMDVVIENRLQMDITSLTFYLRNAGLLSNILVHDTISPIPVGTTVTSTTDLAGKTVESSMVAKMESISIGGTPGGTVLDPNSYIRLKIIVRGLTASRATSVFPAQTVINDRSKIKYRFDNGVEITKIKSKTGHVVLDAISTIKDTIEFFYSLPTAIKNGQPVSIYGRLVPQPSGVSTTHVDQLLDDYYIDMTYNGDSVNLFPYHLIGNLLYSGVKHTMDLTDSIDLSYGLQGIQPSYIEGYLGQSTFNFADTINFSLFSSILGGTLDLSNPSVKLTIDNSIGVDGELKVHQMDAVNNRTQHTIPLTGTLMSQPTEVRGPRLPNVGQTISTPILLNQSNSNIRPFISSLPDEIRFNMEVLVNKNGNPALHDNFATDQSAINAYLDIEVPFDGISDHLWLQDTVAINVSDATLPKGIQSGKLKLVGSNQFPFEAQVQLLFVDAQGVIFDSLFHGAPQTLPAGHVNASGYVDVPGTGDLIADWDQIGFTRLKQRGVKAIARFVLSTKPTATPVKLYTNYGIDFYLVGDVNYHIGH